MKDTIVSRAMRVLMVVGAFGVVTTLATYAHASKGTAKRRAAAAALLSQLDGYSCRDTIEMSRLAEDEAFMIHTTLYRGNDYKIIGAGDEGIKDLDLEIYDEDWDLIDSDTMRDPVPILSVHARGTGRAHIKVVAYEGGGWATAVICFK